MTFDVLADVFVGRRYNWASVHEAAVQCRRCRTISVLKVELCDSDRKWKFEGVGGLTKFEGDLEPTFRSISFLDVSDLKGVAIPPADLPPAVEAAFVEGAKCLAIGCHNAGAAMFRLCLDLVTKPMLPDPGADEAQPTKRQRYVLFDRIEWLIGYGHLPAGLAELAHCVRQDGNDGAHDGSLGPEDAADMLDFTVALLERVYTEPARLAAARDRQTARRAARED